MIFFPLTRTYITRYFSALVILIMMIFMLGFFSLYALDINIFLDITVIFFTYKKLSILLIAILFISQIGGYFDTQKAIKSLALEDQSLLYELFNKQKEKILYTDILSFSYTNDAFKNFEITLKNGEKKVIYPTIKKKEEAFKLIQQKILESQNKDK